MKLSRPKEPRWLQSLKFPDCSLSLARSLNLLQQPSSLPIKTFECSFSLSLSLGCLPLCFYHVLGLAGATSVIGLQPSALVGLRLHLCHSMAGSGLSPDMMPHEFSFHWPRCYKGAKDSYFRQIIARYNIAKDFLFEMS